QEAASTADRRPLHIERGSDRTGSDAPVSSHAVSDHRANEEVEPRPDTAPEFPVSAPPEQDPQDWQEHHHVPPEPHAEGAPDRGVQAAPGGADTVYTGPQRRKRTKKEES